MQKTKRYYSFYLDDLNYEFYGNSISQSTKNRSSRKL